MISSESKGDGGHPRHDRMIKLILASGSPRRHEILQSAGIAHEVRPVDADESVPEGTTPERVPAILAERKARAAVERVGASPGEQGILASDTVVICGGEIFGKPKDAAHAERMLRALSGAKHTVVTGVCVPDGSRLETDAVATDVYMREITRSEIESYVALCRPTDKAGAYGIQAAAGAFVRRIDGDYSAVVGLPLCRTVEMLGDFGIPLFAE